MKTWSALMSTPAAIIRLANVCHQPDLELHGGVAM